MANPSDLIPSQLKPAWVDADGNLKPSLTRSSYSGGTPTANDLKPSLLSGSVLKPALSKDGSLKASLTSGGADNYTPLVEQAIAHWKLDDNAATTAVVDSRSLANGTLQNAGNTSANSVAGKIGAALNFSNAGYVDGLGSVSDFRFVHATHDFAIAFWMKNNSLSARQAVVANVSGGTARGFFVTYEDGAGQGDQAIRFHSETSTGTILDCNANGCIPDGGWHHIVINGLGNDVDIYVDKVSQTLTYSTTFQGNVFSNSTRSLTLGRLANVNVLRVQSDLDDVLIFDRALTVDEIGTLHDEGV